MPYIVPTRSQISRSDQRLHFDHMWDGSAPIQADEFALYETPDYTVPAASTPRMKKHNSEIVSEESILAAHAEFVKVKSALAEIGLLGEDNYDDGINFFQAQEPFGRVIHLRSMLGDRPLAAFHLLKGEMEGYSRYLGSKSTNLDAPVNDEFISFVRATVENTKGTLVHHGVEPTPRNVRKTILFQNENRLTPGCGWTTNAPKFTESFMRFLRADVSMETILLFHCSGQALNPPSRSLDYHHQVSSIRFVPSAKAKIFSEEEVQTLASLPTKIISELYDDGGMRHCGSELVTAPR